MDIDKEAFKKFHYNKTGEKLSDKEVDELMQSLTGKMPGAFDEEKK